MNEAKLFNCPKCGDLCVVKKGSALGPTEIFDLHICRDCRWFEKEFELSKAGECNNEEINNRITFYGDAPDTFEFSEDFGCRFWEAKNG